MEKPHLADVAREAGVSVGAASLALSGRGRISETTRERVRQAAERLGYAADPVARAMRVGHLPLVGLVITDLADPADFEQWSAFWSRVLASLSAAAARRNHGFVLLPRLTGTPFTMVPLAGYAIIGTDVPASEVEAAIATGLPVLADNLSGDAGAAVRLDFSDEAAVLAALDHLRVAGARRPGVLGASLDTAWGRGIIDACTRWTEANGIDCPVVDVESGAHPGEHAVDHLLDLGVDAIVTLFTDPGLPLAVAERRNRSIGADLLLVAVDEDVSGHHSRSDITTVGVDLADVIDRAVDAFIDVAEGHIDPPVDIVAVVRVEPRASTSPRA